MYAKADGGKITTVATPAAAACRLTSGKEKPGAERIPCCRVCASTLQEPGTRRCCRGPLRGQDQPRAPYPGGGASPQLVVNLLEPVSAALEDAGLLTWVHRLVKVRLSTKDLFGHWGSEWTVHRTSNGYRLLDPLEREPGRKTYKSENPTRPQNQEKQKEGAPLIAAQVISEETSQAPPSRRKHRLLSNESTSLGPKPSWHTPSGFSCLVHFHPALLHHLGNLVR